jgi:hypothetical protein
MELIDNGDLHINNIIPKMQMMRTLVQQILKERDDDFTTEKERNEITKEIFRIKVRLNNYQYKLDLWVNEMIEDILP